MSPRALSFVLACLLINGCGSSDHAGAKRPSGVAGGTTETVGAPAPSAPGAGSATATTAPSPGPGSGGSNARLPATFVITGRGSLSPTSISAPAGVAIVLTVISGDGRAHQVVLGGTPARPLAVPAHGRVSLRLSGLKMGRYQLAVDGVSAGALVIGVQPGP